ncbi:MAG: amidohydrolase family protein [Desulfovibrio sp.]|jgi:cytosine/adenosine deaminase-related metal-dependent hydrolase|nr:amidohydrolase family protein [Desulfovibrio sp.]
MLQAFRAKSVITLAQEGAARGIKALEAPLAELDDGVIVVEDKRVVSVESFSAFRRSVHSLCSLTDLGYVRLAPALINAHCHLELSHLAGATRGGGGFTAWLLSLIPLAAEAVLPEVLLKRLHAVLEQVRHSGTVHVGDVGSRNPALVAQAAEKRCGITHFLEVFGFGRPAPSEYIPQVLAAQGYCPEAAAFLSPDRYDWCAIAGHSLYSVSPEALLAAFAWCRERRRPFSVHLAESGEEEECLLHGKGALYELLRQRLLPHDWRHPGMKSTAYAGMLGLLGPRTLAVHCVQCSSADISLLARKGTNVCLCPRSNHFIGTGLAPAERMAEKGVLLCLGTDSLASNHDLDMKKEMQAARTFWGFSDRAVLRMATVNAAHALDLGHLGVIAPGKTAAFFIYPDF